MNTEREKYELIRTNLFVGDAVEIPCHVCGARVTYQRGGDIYYCGAHPELRYQIYYLFGPAAKRPKATYIVLYRSDDWATIIYAGQSYKGALQAGWDYLALPANKKDYLVVEVWVDGEQVNTGGDDMCIDPHERHVRGEFMRMKSY